LSYSAVQSAPLAYPYSLQWIVLNLIWPVVPTVSTNDLSVHVEKLSVSQASFYHKIQQFDKGQAKLWPCISDLLIYKAYLSTAPLGNKIQNKLSRSVTGSLIL
jgi:hypothetical protein